MAKEPSLTPNKEWTKSAAARNIIECQKQLLELQSLFFGLLGTLEEGKYKKATEVAKKLISEVKNQNLVLQALLLEFDGDIPIDEENAMKALTKLRDALKDTEE